MKASRVYLTMVASSIGALALVILVCLAGYFRAVDTADSSAPSESRLLGHMDSFHVQLRSTEDPEIAKRLMKAFENQFGSGSEALDKVRRAYNPVLAQFASKPKEADAKFYLVKKRDLLESLVNSYRKEIPNGSIPLRAAYLDLLFATQNSLINETPETEAVYLKKGRELFNALRSAAVGREAAVTYRINALDSTFSSMERGFELASRWRTQRDEALAKAEKAAPRLVKEIRASLEGGGDDLRRSYLYSAIFAVIVLLASTIALYVGHKLMKHRFESRADALARYVKEFGREKMDPAIGKAAELLASDPDWEPVLAGAKEAEEEFARTYQTLLSVPKSLKLPYFVLTRDRTVIHRSEAAAEIFGSGDLPLDEIVCDAFVSCRDGDPRTVIETIRNSFTSPREDSHEILLKVGEEWIATELMSYPISTGPIAGGRVYLFRQVRDEAERVERAVAHQISRLRDYVHKITHFYEFEIEELDTDSKPVREALRDMSTMKLKLDEREALWKSEALGLIDQIERQKEILARLSQEIEEIRARNVELKALVSSIHDFDESWHDEILVIERDMERWMENRQRIISELGNYSNVMGRIRKYESELRNATEVAEIAVKEFDKAMGELQKYRDEAKVHAVNLSFVNDPSYREYAAHARSFANALDRFTSAIGGVMTGVKNFLSRHPGGALFPYLESADLDPVLLENLKEEQVKFSGFLKRWKSSGVELVEDGQKALGILHEVDKKGELVTQLGETSLLINEQAKGNVERWN